MFGGTFGVQELVVIMLLVLILFGARKIPEVMKGFGQGLGEFKSAVRDWNKDIEEAAEEANRE